MINASVICMNSLSIETDARLLMENNISRFHFDIMDSSYVRRFGLYPEIYRDLRQEFDFLGDCHFMVQDVAKGIKEWCSYGVPQKISFHYKDNKHIANYLVEMIKDFSADPILAIDIDVSIDEVNDAINKFNPAGLMFLSIIPGVLKQTHKPEQVFSKIEALKSSPNYSKIKHIQVDGGVNLKTIPKLLQSGANDLICGSSTLFKNLSGLSSSQRDIKICANIQQLNSIL